MGALSGRLQAERLKINPTVTGLCVDKANLCVRYNVPNKNITKHFSLFREGQLLESITSEPMPAGAPLPSAEQTQAALQSLLSAQKIPQEEAELGIRVAVAFADQVVKNWSALDSLTTQGILSEALAQVRETERNPDAPVVRWAIEQVCAQGQTYSLYFKHDGTEEKKRVIFFLVVVKKLKGNKTTSSSHAVTGEGGHLPPQNSARAISAQGSGGSGSASVSLPPAGAPSLFPTPGSSTLPLPHGAGQRAHSGIERGVLGSLAPSGPSLAAYEGMPETVSDSSPLSSSRQQLHWQQQRMHGNPNSSTNMSMMQVDPRLSYGGDGGQIPPHGQYECLETSAGEPSQSQPLPLQG
uniref:Uncharacterized protein n=1 Tax=Chromera velia CCMP2878 TaxID=1169474 RepID=A0A0G4FS94_9ALVE|eukprot:Cvel_3687.t1-p1 / transcript=Cvel_3687.t1 / gene=Cvel_3687 / organism=Chromera_velia_CCMP2878 / gene_product=hypothetical protein / transcript_product=hypothetical protein / location=Cvel_scaffold153:50639-53970(-) / protein_length=352 / sequence_SO=supercontig / SO=protein_coding / is_pseudo=false